jgi:hypothetical protein
VNNDVVLGAVQEDVEKARVNTKDFFAIFARNAAVSFL